MKCTYCLSDNWRVQVSRLEDCVRAATLKVVETYQQHTQLKECADRLYPLIRLWSRVWVTLSE